MIEIVWEIITKPDYRSQLELTYGPGGAWSKLFARQPGFHGITVLHDAENNSRYLVIETWDNENSRKAALENKREEYRTLAVQMGKWIERHEKVGIYRLSAGLGVKPAYTANRRKNN